MFFWTNNSHLLTIDKSQTNKINYFFAVCGVKNNRNEQDLPRGE